MDEAKQPAAGFKVRVTLTFATMDGVIVNVTVGRWTESDTGNGLKINEPGNICVGRFCAMMAASDNESVRLKNANRASEPMKKGLTGPMRPEVVGYTSLPKYAFAERDMRYGNFVHAMFA